MNTLSRVQSRLDRLEAQLQTLIEGSTARLFPHYDSHDEFARRLLSSMQQGIISSPDEGLIAPNLFTLYIHPTQSKNIENNHELLEELALVLQNAGKEAGINMVTPPEIQIMPNENIPIHDIFVSAQVTIENLGPTDHFQADDGEAEPPEIPPGAYMIINGTDIYPLNQAVINIGRRPDNHLVINDGRISRVHAQIRLINNRFVIFDLDSTGGTSVNNRPVYQCVLSSGDVISLAGVPIIYGQETPEFGETQKISPFPED